ncbi:MAG TPA: MFS transporter [Armatimonadota bacterium]|nr:MFS transporter [Armatimonadota bacterium]
MAESGTTPQPDTSRRVTTLSMWMALIAAFSGWMFDGLEMGLYSIAVPPALKDLMGTTDPKITGPLMGIMVALFLAGMAAGGILFGRLGDRIGRVKTMIITVLMYAVFTGLSGLSQSWQQLAACRFLGAMGLGGEWGLGVALVMESWPSVSRPLLAGLLGAAANFGFLAASGVGFLQANLGWTWRPVLMIGFVPAMLTLLIRLYVKEPELFVRSRQRGETSRFVDLFSPEFRRRTLIGMGLGAVAVLGLWGTVQSWLQLWVTELVKPGSPSGPIAAVTMAMAVGAIIGGFLGGLSAEWLGRRLSFALQSAASLGLVSLLYLTCTEYGTRMLVLTVVVQMAQVAMFGWLPLYLPELFPTRLRATGEGFCFNVGRVVSAAGVLIGTGKLSAALGSIPNAAMLMSLIYVVGIVLAVLAPETKGQELPE